MELTLTGHAGCLVRAGGVSVLCDPWFNPAYFAILLVLAASA